MTQWVILAVGVVLCFLGVGSAHVMVLTSGFGACWLLAVAVDVDPLPALLIALCGALLLWLLVLLLAMLVPRRRPFSSAQWWAPCSGRCSSRWSRTATSASLPSRSACRSGYSRVSNSPVTPPRWLVWLAALAGAGLILNARGRPVDEDVLPRDESFITFFAPMGIWVTVALLGFVTQRVLMARKASS
ncbi:hypothetical protein [Cryptosporangium aurantiacum]|uniref:Uncharacterized protein n=1 Tax=Cryptosporangium aurantiacum TaxID=134849 RepID=A0A1M7PRB0_9ACTN|nr:hypothetical protein [Cryptosporangium aurantiacum]SHN19858.1 hypothetical protein SAMN05443668_103604 [Cryptosporangium aurantiacum]